jgi:hypothetical protein
MAKKRPPRSTSAPKTAPKTRSLSLIPKKLPRWPERKKASTSKWSMAIRLRLAKSRANPTEASAASSKKEKAPPLEDKNSQVASGLRGDPGEGGVELYSGQGREGPSNEEDTKFVGWSSSTEIGDFIRGAARGKEFAVEIEGASKEIRVGVTSYNDRTHYLRVRLRKTSNKLRDLASLKKECDDLAHKSAQRLAMGGFGVLGS